MTNTVYLNEAGEVVRTARDTAGGLAIPHYIFLIVLTFVGLLAVIVSWFAVLVTGKYPRTLFDFVVGVGRWWLRVVAYAFLLVTDRYPPFSLH